MNKHIRTCIEHIYVTGRIEKCSNHAKSIYIKSNNVIAFFVYLLSTPGARIICSRNINHTAQCRIDRERDAIIFAICKIKFPFIDIHTRYTSIAAKFFQNSFKNTKQNKKIYENQCARFRHPFNEIPLIKRTHVNNTNFWLKHRSNVRRKDNNIDQFVVIISMQSQCVLAKNIHQSSHQWMGIYNMRQSVQWINDKKNNQNQ